jgi:hypothetical protein
MLLWWQDRWQIGGAAGGTKFLRGGEPHVHDAQEGSVKRGSLVL